MRIAFALPWCTPENSHGRYVIELATQLAGSASVEIWSGAFSDEIRKTVACHRLPVVNRPALARLGMLWTWSLVAVRLSRCDLVHIQGADAPIGDVVTAHCCNAAMRETRAGTAGIGRRLNARLGIAAERYCLTRPSTRRVIAVSAKVAGEIERHYQVPPARIEVITPGVNLQEFHPDLRPQWRGRLRAEWGLSAQDFVVLFVGADYVLKGFPTLLEAAARLGRRVRILAVGVPLSRAVDALLTRFDLHDRVTLLPATRNLARIYAAADCFALPTRYDTFSLVTLEAMASGLPVVVSRAAGVAELLEPGGDALLMDRPDDVAGLAEHLESLLEDGRRADRLAAAARRTAERHSWSGVAQRVMAVYRSVSSVQ